jgi:membrane associated rhomboid family serine protease
MQHLLANSVPLLVLGAILCARSRLEFLQVVIAGMLVGGLLTWLIARPASHIGASGIVFTFFGYLVSLAFFNRTIGSFLLALVCVVLYGGIIRGILPTSAAISWEGHLAGLAAGVALGWLQSRVDVKTKASPAPVTAQRFRTNTTGKG